MNVNELVLLVAGLVTLVIILLNWRAVVELRHMGLLLAAGALELLSYLFTNVEALAFPAVSNLLEHVCGTLAVLLLLAWVLVFRAVDEEER